MSADAGRRVRLFVALELPPPIVTTLVDWAGAVLSPEMGLRRLDAASLHVTLCFLGSRPADEIGAIARICERSAGAPAPTLAVGGALWLPRRRPRVLAVDLADSTGAAGALQASLATELESAGFYTAERRAFLAHVTVARARAGARMREHELAPPPPEPFMATRVTLFRSHLQRGGARYEPLATGTLCERTV